MKIKHCKLLIFMCTTVYNNVHTRNNAVQTEREVFMIVQEQVYSIDEAARILKVNPKTIRRMIERGEIRSHKVGRQHRIPRSEIEKFLSGEAQKPED
jgi:excisionase family DNA binding protein